jgi:hypothetical protein
MAEQTCERCGALPPRIESGPWAGSRHLLDYCESCSKNLCDDCLNTGRCRESTDKRHHRVES